MILKEFWLDNYTQIYFKFKELNEITDTGLENSKPYISFNLGIKIFGKSWADFETVFQGEDGFVMDGDYYSEFLDELKEMTKNNHEGEIVISDYLADTDAEVHIKYEDYKVVVYGHLGEEYNLDIGKPVLKFSIATKRDFLSKLYDTLNEMTLFY